MAVTLSAADPVEIFVASLGLSGCPDKAIRL